MTISYVERESATPEVNAFYDKCEERFQMLPNAFKVMAHTPDLAFPLADLILAILKDGELPWITKELIILKATHHNECHYCVIQHEALGQRLGLSKEKIADLKGDRYRTSSHFNEEERALLDLTVQIADDANRIPKALWKRVHAHFTEPQIVEAVTVATAYFMMSKYGDTLGVQLEEVFSDADPIMFKKAS